MPVTLVGSTPVLVVLVLEEEFLFQNQSGWLMQLSSNEDFDDGDIVELPAMASTEMGPGYPLWARAPQAPDQSTGSLFWSSMWGDRL